jgi:hypothetical protein
MSAMTAAIRPPQPLPTGFVPAELVPAEPPLVLIPGGRDAARRRRRTQAIYRRRRWAVALLATVSVFVVLVAAQLVEGQVLASGPAASSAASTDPDPSATVSSGTGAPSVGAARSVVVQPGDSAWSIARRLQPTGDIRPLVDRLVERTGGGVLRAGERLDLQGLTP